MVQYLGRLLLVSLIFWLCVISTSVEAVIPKNPETFGPGYMELVSYELCKGPKQENYTEISVVYTRIQYSYKMNMNVTFLIQTRIDEITTIIYMIKKNYKSLILTSKIKKPCEHFLYSSIMDTYLGQGSNCIAKQRTYHLVFNTSELIKLYFGTSFYYGEFILKNLALSKKGNLMCIISKVRFIKK